MSENLINSIQQLILLGKGDRGRLEYILDLVSRDKTLPMSDQKYLENIIPLYLGSQDTETFQKQTEQTINSMYKEMQALEGRLEKLENRGFERYVGRKAIFFFVTVFVGWHAFQNPITAVLGQYIPTWTYQYLFPLNWVAGGFGAVELVRLVFVLMSLAWPFIGAVHLVRFIRSRKISKQGQA